MSQTKTQLVNKAFGQSATQSSSLIGVNSSLLNNNLDDDSWTNAAGGGGAHFVASSLVGMRPNDANNWSTKLNNGGGADLWSSGEHNHFNANLDEMNKLKPSSASQFMKQNKWTNSVETSGLNYSNEQQQMQQHHQLQQRNFLANMNGQNELGNDNTWNPFSSSSIIANASTGGVVSQPTRPSSSASSSSTNNSDNNNNMGHQHHMQQQQQQSSNHVPASSATNNQSGGFHSHYVQQTNQQWSHQPQQQQQNGWANSDESNASTFASNEWQQTLLSK